MDFGRLKVRLLEGADKNTHLSRIQINLLWDRILIHQKGGFLT